MHKFHIFKFHHFYRNLRNIYQDIDNTCLEDNLHNHLKYIIIFVMICHCKNNLLSVMNIYQYKDLYIHHTFQNIFNTHFSLNYNLIDIPYKLDLLHLIYKKDNFQDIFNNLPLLLRICINIHLVNIL